MSHSKIKSCNAFFLSKTILVTSSSWKIVIACMFEWLFESIFSDQSGSVLLRLLIQRPSRPCMQRLRIVKGYLSKLAAHEKSRAILTYCYDISLITGRKARIASSKIAHWMGPSLVVAYRKKCSLSFILVSFSVDDHYTDQSIRCECALYGTLDTEWSRRRTTLVSAILHNSYSDEQARNNPADSWIWVVQNHGRLPRFFWPFESIFTGS